MTMKLAWAIIAALAVLWSLAIARIGAKSSPKPNYYKGDQ